MKDITKFFQKYLIKRITEELKASFSWDAVNGIIDKGDNAFIIVYEDNSTAIITLKIN